MLNVALKVALVSQVRFHTKLVRNLAKCSTRVPKI